MSDRPLVILITGCSSGFGLLTAARLAAAGHRVHATMRDLNKRDPLPIHQSWVDEIRVYGNENFNFRNQIILNFSYVRKAAETRPFTAALLFFFFLVLIGLNGIVDQIVWNFFRYSWNLFIPKHTCPAFGLLRMLYPEPNLSEMSMIE